MDKNLENEKKELGKELARILDKIPELKKKQDPAALEVNFQLAVAKLTQLYYLNFYQVDHITSLDDQAKSEVKKEIMQEYKMELVKLCLKANK